MPEGSLPSNFAARIQLAPSTPPITAARSMTGATAGWTCLAPKQMTVSSPAASLAVRAAVAHPLELARKPRIVVSNIPNSSYGPSIRIKTSFEANSSPSGTAHILTCLSLRRCKTSPTPAKTPVFREKISATTGVLPSPSLSKISRVLTKYMSVVRPRRISSCSAE